MYSKYGRRMLQRIRKRRGKESGSKTGRERTDLGPITGIGEGATTCLGFLST